MKIGESFSRLRSHNPYSVGYAPWPPPRPGWHFFTVHCPGVGLFGMLHYDPPPTPEPFVPPAIRAFLTEASLLPIQE
jgi:hypothetical protein